MRVVTKAFFAAAAALGLWNQKADKQVGGEADQFPANEEQQQAVGDDHAEHGAGEQRQEREEPREIRVRRHVADAVNEDQQADEGHHHQHHRRERIEHPAELKPCPAELEPREIEHLPRLLAVTLHRFHEGGQREQQGQRHCPNGEAGREPPAAPRGQRAHAAASNGSMGINPRMLTIDSISPLQRIHPVQAGGLVMAVEGDDEGETHRRLRRRNADGKQGEQDAGQGCRMRTEAPKGDELRFAALSMSSIPTRTRMALRRVSAPPARC